MKNSHTIDSHCERDDSEIEVTPEMIEAGMEVFRIRWFDLLDGDDVLARETLRDCYRAMLINSRQSR